jgi:hypothetical protein
VAKRRPPKAEKLLNSATGRLVKRELAQHVNVDDIARRIRGLDELSSRGRAIQAAQARLSRTIDELDRLAPARASTRRKKGLRHLYDPEGTPDPVRDQYISQLKLLTDVLRSDQAGQLLSSQAGRRSLFRQSMALVEAFGKTIDNYAYLKVETGAYNAIVRALYPEEVTRNIIDSHHIIEERTYHKFRDTWQKLGWGSADMMPATPLMSERHRRSPKRLPGMEESGHRLNLSSLSTDLQKAVNLDKIDSVDELLLAYKRAYSNPRIGGKESYGYVLRFLDNVKREIPRARDRSRLVREVRELRK